MSRILPILIIASFIVMSTLSCKSTKSMDNTEQKVIIQLTQKLTEDYISETYAMYMPTKVKRSNKTLNQYLATFTLDKVRYKGLINLLNEDDNVIKLIEKSNSNLDKAVNSTNVMKSSAKPETK
jgi:hypothetical protein